MTQIHDTEPHDGGTPARSGVLPVIDRDLEAELLEAALRVRLPAAHADDRR